MPSPAYLKLRLTCPSVSRSAFRLQSCRLFSQQKAIILVGKTLSHYEILEPLGAGGMGEVYRARDTMPNWSQALPSKCGWNLAGQPQSTQSLDLISPCPSIQRVGKLAKRISRKSRRPVARRKRSNSSATRAATTRALKKARLTSLLYAFE